MTTPINISKPNGNPSTSQKPTYISAGRALSSPPLSAQIRSYLSLAYCFLGLYFTTLFSLDSTSAAANSSFARRNGTGASAGGRSSFPKPRMPFFGGGSGGSGNGGNGRGPPGGGSGRGGRKLGTVDDVRGPECKSCQ
ncbi:hypothetical protein B9Z65_1429 [Elsinoe australis]|uniref:Uncharacterized protein n=1 Tax=Elsinoe australis TaxID=40998 RepID=A0A2P7YFV8_9PEZI|nr:hypothetical protein B9Z65_1429 [Elsinoe australis]